MRSLLFGAAGWWCINFCSPLSLVTAYHGTLVVTCSVLVVFHPAGAWGD